MGLVSKIKNMYILLNLLCIMSTNSSIS